MINKILNNWPLLLILFIWFIFSSPYFFQNKTPYPAKFQNSFFSPWKDYDEFAIPVKNPALSDVVTQLYPWKHFTIEQLKKGELPWWNPYSFSGNPHIANIQSAVFSPFNLLFFMLPFIDAWSLLILLQPLLAGFFMRLYLKELKISNQASFLGSITFMFCGFLVVWMPYGTLSMAIAFLPLALYAIEKSFKKLKIIPLLLLSSSIALSFFSGHFQTSLYLASYSLIYIIFKSLISKDLKKSLIVISFYLLGFLISLLQIIPAFNLLQHSLRSELFSVAGAIPISYLITIVAPDYFGNPVTGNEWVGHYAEWAGFIGMIPFSFALFALIKINKYTLFFLTMGIVSLIFAVDSPFQTILVDLKLPILSTSIPSRIIVLFSFSFAILAAFGLDNYKTIISKRKFKKPLLILSTLLIFCLTIWSLLFVFKILPPDKTTIAFRNFIIPTVTLFIFSSITLTIFKLKSQKIINIAIYLLIIVALFDSFRFAQKWIPFDPKDLVFPDLPVISAMQKDIGNGRVFGSFGSYIDTYYRLPSIEGYDPLFIQRYGEFISSAKNGEFTPAEKSLVILDRRAKYADRVLDLLGVSLIFHVIGDTNKEWAYPVWSEKYFKKYSIVYEDDKFQLYKNKDAFPRVKMFYDYEVIKNKSEIIKKFYSDNFDYKKKLILEESPGLKKSSSPKNSKVSITSYQSNKITIEVNTPSAGLLFISDNYYPNWKAKVNGKDTKIIIANYSFRSIVLDEGKSKVEFYYNEL